MREDAISTRFEPENGPPLDMLVAGIALDFAAVPSAQVDRAIEEAQRRIVEALGIDGSSLLQFSESENKLVVTHSWVAPVLQKNPRLAGNTDAPWSLQTVLRGEVLCLSSLDDLPPEAADDARSFRAMGLKSSLMFPLSSKGKVVGVLALDTCREQRQWPAELVGRVRLAAQMFGNMLARKRAEEAERRTETRYSEFFASAALNSLHGEVVTLDRTGTIVTANEAWFRFARENGANPAAVSPGVNYLEVCRRALAAGDPLVGKALEAIEAVLRGSCEYLSLEYPCDSPTSARWFLMRVAPFKSQNGGAVIIHLDITELKDAQNSLKKALAEVEQLKEQIHAENVYLHQKVKLLHSHKRVVGQSAALRQALTQVEQVAGTDSTVLLLGETGTGKELLATSIHQLSPRGTRVMVIVNCAAMPAALVESELFGREKGAFTGSLSRQVGRFELADNSTLFLDEVGDLPLETQAKLLRALEERQIERLGNPKPIPVNVRLIAATNHDLAKGVAAGTFRQDLYYRLNVFPITVPPLRERREDIPLLVWAFVDEFAKAFNKNIESVQRESLNALQRYSWPGNVRELRNIVERAMIVATGPKLRIHLSAAPAPSPSIGGSKLVDVEREHILSALVKSGWRVRGPNGAAAKLGLKPTTLEARMVRLGVRRPTSTSEN